MKRCVLLAATALAVAVEGGVLPETIKVYSLTNGRPCCVDGDISDWNAALFRDDVLTLKTERPEVRSLAFAMQYDGGTLYIAFRATGPYRSTGQTPKKDSDIWKDADVIEVFFGKACGAHGFTQFSVSADGGLFDAQDGDSFVNLSLKGGARRTKDGWTAELSIPLKELEIDPTTSLGFRMNVSQYFPAGQALSWSLGNNRIGFRDEKDMGYVVFGSFAAAARRNVDLFSRKNGVRPSAMAKDIVDEASYRAFLNQLASEGAVLSEKRARQSAEMLAAAKNLPGLLAAPWDEDDTFAEDRQFQIERLTEVVSRQGRGFMLAFTNAVNGLSHRAFTLSAVRGPKTVTFACGGFSDANGRCIPGGQLKVVRFGFLHTPTDMTYGTPVPDPVWPELVEAVSGPETIEACSSGLFRLYVDTADAAPGDYRGEFRVLENGKIIIRIPITCRVRDLTLPKAESHPFPVYLFTTIPFGGKSAELWAEFFRRHYVTDVSMEHPDVFVNGELVKDFRDKANNWTNYLHQSLTYRTPVGAAVTFDFKSRQMDERIAACAKYGLRIEMSNRSGHILLDHLPAMVRELGRFGFPSTNLVYKLGDEDKGPVFLPVARRIRELVPDIQVSMIPAGNSWWDISVLDGAYTEMQFSRAAFRLGEKGDRDIAFLRSRGMRVSRYLNDAAWAGRVLPVRVREEPWAALIKDGLDGYACWTGCIWPRLDYRTGYNTRRKYDFRELPPERQWGTMLIYSRRDGDVYRPVSCRRLEDIRDGLVDALYYREVTRRLKASGDEAGLSALHNIVFSAKRKYADYESARERMAKLLDN